VLALGPGAWSRGSRSRRRLAAGTYTATGNNPDAARLAGVRTRRVLIAVYTSAGLLYGIAALVLIGRTGVGDPQAGQSANLDSIHGRPWWEVRACSAVAAV